MRKCKIITVFCRSASTLVRSSVWDALVDGLGKIQPRSTGFKNDGNPPIKDIEFGSLCVTFFKISHVGINRNPPITDQICQSLQNRYCGVRCGTDYILVLLAFSEYHCPLRVQHHRRTKSIQDLIPTMKYSLVWNPLLRVALKENDDSPNGQ